MADLGRASRGPAAGAPRRLRAAPRPKVLVTICAWCGARAVGDTWSGRLTRPDVLAALDRANVLTHGICPSCFDTEASNHAYPPRAS